MSTHLSRADCNDLATRARVGAVDNSCLLSTSRRPDDLGMAPPIDPRRGIRIAAEANYQQARRLRRAATVFLAVRADELEDERDELEQSSE